MSRFIVYALVDPRTGEVRYIGKSSSGLRRPRAHRGPAKLNADHGTYKARWIRGLLAAGLMYEIRVFEELQSESGLSEAEIRWIAHGRACGWPLTNTTDGGDGASGAVRSPELRARISAALMGHPVSDEARSKMGAGNRGKKRPYRPRAPFSKEHREKLGAAGRGRTMSPEAREKIAAWHRGRKFGPHSEEQRRKQSESLAGYVKSEEHRRRLSEAAKRQHQRRRDALAGADSRSAKVP